MGSLQAEPSKPWIETPCIRSAPLSRAAGCNVFLKLENLQPSGSFKSRGVGNIMFRAAEASDASPSSPDIHFYCSSGGNAGLACATSAIALGRKATIVVPLTTSQYMIGKLKDLGADVVQIGDNWSAADAHLRKNLLENHDPHRKGVYVPPFDHPDVWAGAATIIDELCAQMHDTPIDGVVCSVGGGGLFCGIMEGIERKFSASSSWDSQPRPKVLAVETVGAESLNASVKAGELVTLPAITSVATSLGATRVAAKALEWAQRRSDSTVSALVTDADTVMASSRFLDDARILIEPACGATVAPAYNGDLRKHLGRGLSDEEWATRNIVLIVCGGSNINLGLLTEYKKKFGV